MRHVLSGVRTVHHCPSLLHRLRRLCSSDSTCSQNIDPYSCIRTAVCFYVTLFSSLHVVHQLLLRSYRIYVFRQPDALALLSAHDGRTEHFCPQFTAQATPGGYRACTDQVSTGSGILYAILKSDSEFSRIRNCPTEFSRNLCIGS